MTATSSLLVDCDVHCVPSIPQLSPYLSDVWREHFQATKYPGPVPLPLTYPAWNPVTRTAPEELTLQAIRDHVLATASAAVLVCYYGIESFTHPYLARDLATAVNRWLQAEWLDREPRLRASAVLTPQHVEFAVDEIERIAPDPRFVQLLLPARSPAGYGSQRYWPLLRAAARHRLPVAITFGGGTGTPPTPVGWLSSYYEEYNTAILNFQSHILSLVMSGIFQECPDLRIVCTEGGWTWLPGFLWRMDAEWKAFHREVPWVEERPSTYVRRHFRFTTQPFDAPATEPHLSQLLEQIGSEDILMYGSDHPHRYAHDNEELLAAVSPAHASRIRWENACELYVGLRTTIARPSS